MEPVTRIEPITTSSQRDTTRIEDFEAIVAIYRPRIFRFVFVSLRDRDAAETVTQDCFLKAYKAWGRFRGDSSVHTWLMQIAANLVRDVGRNRRFPFWKRGAAPARGGARAGGGDPSASTSPRERL